MSLCVPFCVRDSPCLPFCVPSCPVGSQRVVRQCVSSNPKARYCVPLCPIVSRLVACRVPFCIPSRVYVSRPSCPILRPSVSVPLCVRTCPNSCFPSDGKLQDLRIGLCNHPKLRCAWQKNSVIQKHLDIPGIQPRQTWHANPLFSAAVPYELFVIGSHGAMWTH